MNANKNTKEPIQNDVIKAEVDKITKKLKKWEQRLKDARAACTHPNATKTHHANTGNWCPQDDSYWTTFNCPDCGKIWNMDGSL